jgi:hypothetical protein
MVKLSWLYVNFFNTFTSVTPRYLVSAVALLGIPLWACSYPILTHSSRPDAGLSVGLRYGLVLIQNDTPSTPGEFQPPPKPLLPLDFGMYLSAGIRPRSWNGAAIKLGYQLGMYGIAADLYAQLPTSRIDLGLGVMGMGGQREGIVPYVMSGIAHGKTLVYFGQGIGSVGPCKGCRVSGAPFRRRALSVTTVGISSLNRPSRRSLYGREHPSDVLLYMTVLVGAQDNACFGLYPRRCTRPRFLIGTSVGLSFDPLRRSAER